MTMPAYAPFTDEQFRNLQSMLNLETIEQAQIVSIHIQVRFLMIINVQRGLKQIGDERTSKCRIDRIAKTASLLARLLRQEGIPRERGCPKPIVSGHLFLTCPENSFTGF
jgi:hypothetical protein